MEKKIDPIHTTGFRACKCCQSTVMTMVKMLYCDDEKSKLYRVSCKNCGSKTGIYYDRDMAIGAWNAGLYEQF